MNNDKNNGINRIEFLKKSGLLAAGVSILPRFLNAKPEDGNYNNNEAASKISGYQIVISSRTDSIEKQAASEFQQYVSKLALSEIPVVAEKDYKGRKAIYIGKTNYAKSQKVDLAGVEGDGYIYKSTGDNLIIVGGNKKGVLYGVYDFLEGMGFRKLAPGFVYVPIEKEIKFIKINGVFNPSITYRTTSYGQMGG
ncbi:MAG: alpha-glucuronidase family glycosyl hydrolase, partial [Ginsengibacter sp.]